MVTKRFYRNLIIGMLVLALAGVIVARSGLVKAVPFVPVSFVSILESVPDRQNQIWQKIEAGYAKISKYLGGRLLDQTLSMFANTLSYEIATELATGGPGGRPQFRTLSIGKQLDRAKEAAIGEFIGELSEKHFEDLGLNLCDPSVAVKLSITLSLIDTEAPQPKCNWRDVQRNWEQFGSNLSNDLIKFQLDPRRGADSFSTFFDSFSTEQSDLGAYQRIQEELAERKQEQEVIAQISASECRGYLDKGTTITGDIKTHCSQLLKMSESAWDAAIYTTVLQQIQRKDTGRLSDILLDAANNFKNTFASKLMKRWIQGGTWSLADILGQDGRQSLRDQLLAQLRGGDVSRPRNLDIFQDYQSIEIVQVGQYSFLENYILCPENIEYRTPENCVLNESMFTAITSKLTVQEALERGVVNGATPLIGPQDAERNSNDNCYRDAFCYSNLVKLRKANIIPVGWELAARRSPITSPVKLQEVVDCFEDDPQQCRYAVSDDYAVDGVPHNPYYHLIDPNWVLKAPPAICDALVSSAVLESADSQNRQEYCADPKVCLKEDDQGNCLDGQYGYCVRSENIWRLQGDICTDGDVYSGCLTFTNDNFGNNSYLEGSLDYCTADQVGCRRYSTEKSAAGAFVFQDVAADDDDIYLNAQAQNCPESEAGCSEYIVVSTPSNSNYGPNIFANGDFELDRNTDNVPDGFEAMTFGPNRQFLTSSSECQFGQNCLKLVSGSVGNWWGASRIFEITPGSYNLSAYVKTDGANANQAYVHLKDCGSDPTCSGDNWLTSAGTLSTSWTRISRTETFGPDTRYIVAYIGLGETPLGQTAWIDNIQLQMVGNSTTNAGSYAPYGLGGTVYMNDETVMCSYDEVGCQGYLPNNGDPMIPAVINQADLCPAECVGYSTFAEQITNFDFIEGTVAVEYYNFIPDTATSCLQSAVGCEEFTNLDEVAQGGEGLEYYTYVRQCVQETHPDAQTYFTWEGSDTAGYQIRTWFALKSNIGDGPCTGIDPDSLGCSERLGSIASCGPETGNPNDDPDVNPDCRQFFDEDGASYWRLQSKVVLASNDCHPLRRSETGKVYSGIPSLSQSCQPEENGCREYVGNAGNNVRNIFNDTYENGSFSPWTASNIDLSNESLQNNGHSLKLRTNQDIFRSVPALTQQRDYKLSFWMKSNVFVNNVDIKLQGNFLAGGTGNIQLNNPSSSQFSDIAAGNWHLYSFTVTMPGSLVGYDRNSLRLFFRVNGSDGDIFFDNVWLQEVNSSLTVIKNSWNTPVSCDDPFTGFHLGCQAYTDTNGVEFNLKSFGRLCREEAIGCSLVIDTHNSSYPFAETFNSGDYAEITVPADSVSYLVPDSENYCPSIYKGCTEMGMEDPAEPSSIIEITKINDPDKYGQILCDHEGLNCEAFDSDKGPYFFKYPGLFTCTYQDNVSIGAEVWNGWFKTEDLDTNPVGCSDDGDGTLEESDFEERVGYASLCPASKNLCTGFVDATDPVFFNLGCKVGDVDPEVDGLCSNAAFNTQTACQGAGLSWQIQPQCKTYYYYDNDKIDESSCAGQVDRGSGCVLLYDENDWNSDHSAVNAMYDTQLTYDTAVATGRPVSPVNCDSAVSGSVCDANKLIKVQPDRQCAEWLTCKSSTAVWDPATNQYRILCDEVDSCTEFSNENNITKCGFFDSYSEQVEALTFAAYQRRATGVNEHMEWSDKDYTGYSIPDMLPISKLTVFNFSNNAASSTPRLVYSTTTPSTPACVDGVNDGSACQTVIAGSTFYGECREGTCWVQPLAGQSTTGAFELETRGYATPEAPFPQAISSRVGDTLAEDRLPAYRGANICQVGDDRCEFAYTKNTYSLGGAPLYYPADITAPLAVCVQGKTSDNGQPIDCYDSNLGPVNSRCDSRLGEGDGFCAVKTRQETFLNWTGICLEKDSTTRLPFDRGSDNFCNQWFGVDKISGANSLYDNYQQAGYYDAEGEQNLFCAVGNSYKTTEERIYCGAHYLESDIREVCSILIKIPAGAEINRAGYNQFKDEIENGYLVNTPGNSKYIYHSATDDVGGQWAGGFGVSWIEKSGPIAHEAPCATNSCGCLENIAKTSSMDSLFDFAQFGGDAFGGGKFIPFRSAPTIFDTNSVATPIEFFFYDEEINEHGEHHPEFGMVTPNHSVEYSGWRCDGNCQDPLEACPANMHESWWDGDDPDDWCPDGDGSNDPHYRRRGCNPLPYNIYINSEGSEHRRDGDPWGSISPSDKGDDCTGLSCYQQCDLVTQLDPLGNQSYVKTDIWWRSSDAATSRISGQNWDSYYFAGTSYAQNQNVNFANITGQSTSFSNFGAAQSRTFPADQVVTAVPLPDILVGENAATFYGEYSGAGSWVLSGAEARLSYLFAVAYNWRYDAATQRYVETPSATSHIFTGRRNVYPVGINSNPLAGPDYAPYILRVCVTDSGVGACPISGGTGSQRGFTINNINTGDIIGHKQLFVSTKFYYHAHPDHMPVYDVAINWGDGRDFISTPGRYKNSLPICRSDQVMPGPGSGLQGFGGQDAACRQGYKVFYNIYSYDPDFACGTGGSPAIPNASCYKPQVRVTDQWGRPSLSVVQPTLPNTSTTETYPNWIIIYNE